MKNNNALVLGASGNIGRSVAMHLARAGYNIALHGNGGNTKEMELLQTFLRSKYENQKFETYTMNFDTGEFDAKKLIKNVLHDYEKIDVMVNTVGVMGKTSFANVKEEEVRHLMQVNTVAPFLVTQHVFNHMIQNGGGSIVNLSSFVVRYGMGKNETIHYAMSKSALETMTFGLAQIGGPQGVRCNCVAPGLTDTSQDKIETNNPMGRLANPSEIADAVMFCINNGYMNGETIRVTGGE